MSIKLDRKQRGLLQKALDGKSFELMEEVASHLLMQWTSTTMVDDTAFKTARNAIGREERKKAIMVFLQELQRLAFEKDE